MMKQHQQIELMERLIGMIDNDATEDAGQVINNPSTAYTCPEVAQKEWQAFFENHAQIIGLSADLPEPGSFMTSNDFGIPILATRDKGGKFHVFVNACRHRGAVLTEEPRGQQHRFACPFHAWTYTGDGSLLGIREPKKFGEIDKQCNKLVELPSEEKYGLLVAHPQLDGVIDVDALLGENLAEQFATWAFDKARYLGSSVLENKMNWKLANDTFGENYHFDTLHGKRLNNLFHGDATAYDEYGLNHRLTVPSRYIDVMRTKPQNHWNITDAGIVVYYLFPNVQLVLTNRTVNLFRIYPDQNDVSRCSTKINYYEAQHIGSEFADAATELDGDNVYGADVSQRLEFNLETQKEIIQSTLDEEDYYMAERSQEAAASGRLPHFIFGRNEPALQHFHRSYRQALKIA